MKKTIALILFSVMATLILVGTSCKKHEKDPDFPELIGSWRGTTAQQIPVEIDVSNIGGDLYVTLVNLEYSQSPGDTSQIMRYNSDGLTELIGMTFKLYLDDTPPYESYIDGIFAPDFQSLNGTYYIITESDSSHPITGTYSAVKSK